MSRISDYIIDHQGEEHIEKGWLYTYEQTQEMKSKFTGELSPLAKMAIANPTLVSNATRASLERQYPDTRFPWMDWDGEDFN